MDEGVEGTEQHIGVCSNPMVSGKFGQDSPWLNYGDDSLRGSPSTWATPSPIPPLLSPGRPRAWEQYILTTPNALGRFQRRPRLEQRTVNISGGTAVRFRQLVRLANPLDAAWSLVGANELFINLNSVDWGPAGDSIRIAYSWASATSSTPPGERKSAT